MTRLSLPGPRGLWWLIASLAVVLPFALMAGGRPPESRTRSESLRFQLRLRNVMWRMARVGEDALASAEQARSSRGVRPGAAGAPTKPASAPPKATGTSVAPTAKVSEEDDARPAVRQAPEELSARRLRESRDALRQGLRELFDALPEDDAASREMIVAHALGIDERALALDLAARIPGPSDDLRAALAAAGGSRGEPAPTPLAMAATAASLHARGRDFGGGWGPFTRGRLRARVHALAGERHLARKANDALAWSDEHLLPLLYTVLQGLLLAALFGGGAWILAGLRSAGARERGEPPLSWLTRKHPGLGDEVAYPGDPLLPLLGFGAWLVVYLLAGVLIDALPGQRSAAGLHVLFQSLAGAVFAAWIIATFSRTPLPLDASRLRPSASGVSPWRASTAALWAYAVALPPLILLALINVLAAEVLGFGDSAPHPVVGMLLEDGDPTQVVALGVAVAVGAPLGEELIFRGFLYRTLRQRWGRLAGVLLSSALFAAVHMSPAAFLPYMGLGAAFALSFEWTGSLWAPVILHGLWNAVVFGGLAVVTLS